MSEKEKFEARLCVNPLGPHTYIDSHSLPKHRRYEPRGMADVLHGAVQEACEDKFGSPPVNGKSWYHFIKPRVQFATVKWKEYPENVGQQNDDNVDWEIVDIEIDAKNSEWFSAKPLDYPHEF